MTFSIVFKKGGILMIKQTEYLLKQFNLNYFRGVNGII